MEKHCVRKLELDQRMAQEGKNRAKRKDKTKKSVRKARSGIKTENCSSLYKKKGIVNPHPKVQHLEGKTPFEIWSLLFTDEMVNMIMEQTQLYANRDKSNHDFHILNSELYQFLGIVLFSGYHSLPTERDYWLTQPDLHVSFVTNEMA